MDDEKNQAESLHKANVNLLHTEARLLDLEASRRHGSAGVSGASNAGEAPTEDRVVATRHEMHYARGQAFRERSEGAIENYVAAAVSHVAASIDARQRAEASEAVSLKNLASLFGAPPPLLSQIGDDRPEMVADGIIALARITVRFVPSCGDRVKAFDALRLFRMHVLSAMANHGRF